MLQVFRRLLALSLLVGGLHFCATADAGFDARRIAYNDTALAHFNNSAVVTQAYLGLPVDTASLNGTLRALSRNETADFDIVRLIRVLCLSSGQYDTLILPVLDTIPFWLTKGDTVRNYWSENHMIMWMSSDWLLHEKYGRAIDTSLDIRLRHYLHLKIDYGFYEFFSSVYGPYCLSGLLNLADFAQDTEIKDLATQASQRLLKDLLMLTNDQGTFYPAAGRNYWGKYATPYGQNHNNLIWLLTGMGEVPGGASHAGAFLATSTLPVDSIISSWTPNLDTLYHIGHTLNAGFAINSSQAPLDKTIFQWSSGGYFHPDVVEETANLLFDSLLWHHTDFAPFRQFSTFSIPTIISLANNLSALSKSSVISGQDVHIFKHGQVTLSSVQDFWKGKAGYQQMPVAANVGTTAVLTASGDANNDWEARGEQNNNQHLPYVAQKANVALIMYRPEAGNILLTHPEVALHWMDADFDETVEDGLWLMGRQQDGYVAVRRSCIGMMDSVRACPTVNGQTWVILVGDSDMYGSFSSFQNLVSQSQFTEEWYLDTAASQSVYYAKIEFDTTSIEYAWNRDSVLSGIQDISVGEGFSIYPNPAKEQVTVDVSGFSTESVKVSAMDIMGRKVYAQTVTGKVSIDTQQWPAGVYVIRVEDGERMVTKKLVIE
jgi:hypothetical protein